MGPVPRMERRARVTADVLYRVRCVCALFMVASDHAYLPNDIRDRQQLDSLRAKPFGLE